MAGGHHIFGAPVPYYPAGDVGNPPFSSKAIARRSAAHTRRPYFKIAVVGVRNNFNFAILAWFTGTGRIIFDPDDRLVGADGNTLIEGGACLIQNGLARREKGFGLDGKNDIAH